MILGAALLVLIALGLFVGGIATGATAFYWACVGVSVLAAVLLFVARRQMGRAPGEEADRAGSAALPQTPPDGAPAEDEPAAGHRPPETGDGRGASLRHAEPAGTVAGATAGGVTEDGAGMPGGQPPAAAIPVDDSGDPPVEEVEVSDLLLVVDLRDEVLVVDEHPRYHVAGCAWLAGRTAVPLPLDEARTDGFTPCGQCAPDRHLAQVERARRAQGRST